MKQKSSVFRYVYEVKDAEKKGERFFMEYICIIIWKKLCEFI